ncbi:MAG: RrF2 family transcriptional regulator [Clostridiales bacterium]|nr:RrF2 family transcriptional regulator [Clostridiales bacterium]
MKISTRGRYAVRVLIDLAEHRSGNFVPLKEIAERQDISLKYLESIMTELSKNGLVEGVHGKGGGYRMSNAPEKCTLGMILRVTEGDLAPVACLSDGAQPCGRAYECRTLPVWKKFYEMVNNYFDSITLADLIKTPDNYNYVI